MGLTANVVAATPILSSWGNQIRDRTVQVFADAAERASQWPTPPTGAMSTLVSMPGVLWQYTGTAWKLTAPRGQVAQVTWNAGMTPVTATSDVTGASVSVPIITGHTYRYTVTGHVVSSASGDTVRVSLTNSSNVLIGIAGVADHSINLLNLAQYFTMVTYEVGAADGAAVRKLRVARQAGTGNVQVFSDAFRVGTLTVDEVHVGTSGG